MGVFTRREVVAGALGMAAGCALAPLGGCGRRSPGGAAEIPAAPGPRVRCAGAPPATPCEPSYLAMHRSGELAQRGADLWERLRACDLCPRECGVDRLSGQRGFCGAAADLDVASYRPHWGEERSLVGDGGSGTVFMAHCNLRCVFCINWEISQGGWGTTVDLEDLAKMMLELQRTGCWNINIVTPTHYTPHVVRALDLAAAQGLALPLLWNTCGWEKADTLRALDGIVDIYLPDHKYADSGAATTYSSGASTYPETTGAALLEMHRQVGVARPAADGRMYRGLMIRHLVMPNRVSGTQGVMAWIATHLPADTYVHLMSQYVPVHEADQYPAIDRRITREEYAEAVGWAREAGLVNLDVQSWRG